MIRFQDARSWKVATAAVQGRGHVGVGLPCQDAVASAHRNGVTAVVVCDGAGSAANSHYGARAVSEGISSFLTESADALVELRASKILEVARACIEAERATHGGSSGDYACTLLAVAITEKWAYTVHVGDGAIVGVFAGEPVVVSTADRGEYANTTVFVTSSQAGEHVRLRRMELSPHMSTFALMSDGSAEAGLVESSTGSVSQVVEQVAGWLDRHAEAEVSEQTDRFIRAHLLPRTTDDCTLAVVRRASGAGTSFVCPSCGRWDLRRGPGGKRRFRIVCSACGRLVTCARGPRRSYPSTARAWVHDLVHNRGFSRRAAARTTRVPRRTISRWMRLQRGPQRRARTPSESVQQAHIESERIR